MPPKKKTKKTAKKNPEKSNFAFDLLFVVFFFFLLSWWYIFMNKFYCLVAGETELEAKYRRSVLDVAILQDHIGERQL